MRRPIALLVFFTAAQVFGAVPYDRVLLPMYFEQTVPGAFGSMWHSEFSVHNGSERSYIMEWCSAFADSGCTLDLRGDEELVPNETQTALPARYPKPANGAAGAVIYFSPEGDSADDSKSLSFQLRIADLSRSTITAGTEVPVVRENAFRTSTLNLLGVPADPGFRLLLRVFEMNLDRAEFAVRVFDQSTNVLLSQERLTTSTPAQGDLRFQPGFAQTGDVAAPNSGIATPQPVRLRVEIEPLTSGSAFWAYVSVTNNNTQQVTLVTPQ